MHAGAPLVTGGAAGYRSAMDLAGALRARAAELGFSACGFTTAAPLARGAYFAGWLDAGFAGEMRWLERRADRRLTVVGILPDARTVISLAYPYAPPAMPAIDWRRELRGRVAAYAAGEDYHRTLDRKLATLTAFLADACPGSRTRRYVDTGAVLEREWAVRAGLGWFGKNTMLLSTRAGSWFFLAELITTAALEPDAPPSADHCGTCARCRDACPTGALADGLTMDARRCISYLTIEHRGPIPRALRPAIGPWVFGCDVCQEVCPWNDADGVMRRDARSRGMPWLSDTARPAPAYDTEWLAPSLSELVTLDDDRFGARFGRTPLRRAKRRGLARNAAIALGNTGNPDAVPALAGALRDPEPLVRGHAGWALGAIGGAAARAALDRARASEDDAFAAEEIAAALDAGDAASR